MTLYDEIISFLEFRGFILYDYQKLMLKSLISNYSQKSDVIFPLNMNYKVNVKVPYCYHCGAHVKNQKFCHMCGSKLNWDNKYIRSKKIYDDMAKNMKRNKKNDI
jgi:hypothetical protein